MAKFFNVTAVCKPEEHYMVDIGERLGEIKQLIDDGKYFTINRARQYGKTTTLRALSQYLQQEYYTVLMDFQIFGAGEFDNENIFSLSFANTFLRMLRRNKITQTEQMKAMLETFQQVVDEENPNFRLQRLFGYLSDLCSTADKRIILLIDEVDSASNNQVFLDFLAQLRAYYIDRDVQPTFQSVILAGVYDVKNLRMKFRPEDTHKFNSPWNIAADFKIDMSFSKSEIKGMLLEYEADYHTGMDLEDISGLVYDYTAGYPFLVSKICKLMDEEVCSTIASHSKKEAWTRKGFHEAVRILLAEQNTLFESLMGKLHTYPELNDMLRTLLFTGKSIAYNPDEPSMNQAMMFGFIKNDHGIVSISNRIFETRLYNLYLSAADMQSKEIYKESLQDKSQFIVDGRLDMKLILEKFTAHFHDLYGDSSKTFVEDEGRKYFLLYLRPIINGTGNYYIESRTRGLRRTDVIVDYQGEQYIIEMKIWHGDEYNNRGEKQLVGYMEDYHKDKGYMVSFNFNKKKQIGVREIVAGDKVLVEAVV